MQVLSRIFSLACAALFCAVPCFATETYVCRAPASGTCTVTNVDTGTVTTFQRGETFVINGGNWRLSSNFAQS